MTPQGFQREDGVTLEEERHMQFGALVDKVLPVVIITLLGWLCMATTRLQSEVAVLVERTSTQAGRVDRVQMDLDGLRANESELQREIETARDARLKR